MHMHILVLAVMHYAVYMHSANFLL